MRLHSSTSPQRISLSSIPLSTIRWCYATPLQPPHVISPRLSNGKLHILSLGVNLHMRASHDCVCMHAILGNAARQIKDRVGPSRLIVYDSSAKIPHALQTSTFNTRSFLCINPSETTLSLAYLLSSNAAAGKSVSPPSWSRC
jgi:hypothetical protein